MSAIPALTLAEVTERAIDPALRLLPARMDTPPARVLLLAIGLQESGFRDRRQLIVVDGKLKPLGPAKSFWGAEKPGGMVKGVRTHPATKDLALALYRARGVRRLDSAIWNAIEHDDVLAAGLARLLIYTDPYKLPALGRSQDAWELYAVRLWRPGRPRRQDWDGNYTRALEFVTGQQW
jgi:hypothetical protein